LLFLKEMPMCERISALVVLFAACVMGCGAVASYTPMDDPGYRARPEIDESLFKEDQEVISNEAIKEILESRVALPNRITMAVQELGGNWGYASQEAEKLDIIAQALKTSPRVVGVTSIPELLLRRKPARSRSHYRREPRIPDFREAAARLQCELVLFYRITPDVRYKNRLLRKDKAKVYTTVEAMLLHTRTGIFPFTTLIDKEYEGIEASDDGLWRSFSERARREATVGGLRSLAEEVLGFVKTAANLDPKENPRPTAAQAAGAAAE
jgi:hypothetical protein